MRSDFKFIHVRESLLLSSALVLAFCSLNYELLIAKNVVEVTGNAVLWDSITMASFLFGLGLRALFGKIAEKDGVESLADQFIAAEFGIMLTAIASIPGIMILEALYRVYIYDHGLLRDEWPFPPVYILGIAVQMFSLRIGWLSGIELVFFLETPLGDRLTKRPSKVLAVYHLGAFVGTGWFVASVLILVPPHLLLLATVLINLSLLILWLVILNRNDRSEKSFPPILSSPHLINIALVGGLMMLLGSQFAVLENFMLKNRYYNVMQSSFFEEGLRISHLPNHLIASMVLIEDAPAVRRVRTPFQVIDIVPDHPASPSASLSQSPPGATLHINGRFQINPATAKTYHDGLTHAPLFFTEINPKKILILGGGDGALAQTIRDTTSGKAQVTLIDIDPGMIRLAKEEVFLKQINHDVFSNWPQLSVWTLDAFDALRSSQNQYDLIYIDLTYPYETDSARFYSYEFFAMLKKHLIPEGALALAMPYDITSPTGRAKNKDWQTMFEKTLTKAGFAQLFRGQLYSHSYAVIKSGFKLGEGLIKIHQIPRLEMETFNVPANALGQMRQWHMLNIAANKSSLNISLDQVNSLMFPGRMPIEDGFF